MSDLISRQAAIDALAKFVPYVICDESTESYMNGLTDAYNLICQLPSAQPEQHEGHWIPVHPMWWLDTCTDSYLLISPENVPIFQSVTCVDAEPVSLESIVHPQILDDTEKRYLSAVIKPFRDRVEYIEKTDTGCKREYCQIRVGFPNASNDIYFPEFRESDMYKGMEIGKKYTLEELGL